MNQEAVFFLTKICNHGFSLIMKFCTKLTGSRGRLVKKFQAADDLLSLVATINLLKQIVKSAH